jgi:acetyl esterase
MKETISLSKGIEPSAREFLDTVNSNDGPQLYELSVKDARAVLTDAQAGPVAKLPADIEDHIIEGGPVGQVSIRIVRPEGNKEALPVVMYFHGGGWVLGDKDTHDRLIREIANGAQAAVVFVNYTPSPEAQYPVSIEEAYAATKFIAENGKQFNLDAARLAVVGDSVGGNMVAAVTLMAKERQGPKIGYQVLFYPVTDANFDTDSYKKLATGHFLTREAMKWFWNNYAPDLETRKQITASPLQASVDQLKGLPPALLITGEFDPLHDEGEAYAAKLNEAGVRITAIRYLGIIHDFVMLNAVTNSPQARSAIALANSNLRDFFNNQEELSRKATNP